VQVEELPGEQLAETGREGHRQQKAEQHLGRRAIDRRRLRARQSDTQLVQELEQLPIRPLFFRFGLQRLRRTTARSGHETVSTRSCEKVAVPRMNGG